MNSAAHQRQAISEEERNDLRRFRGRVVFALGIGAGMFPFAVPPLALSTLGRHTASLEFLALVIFSLTVMSASVTAFWRRRLASVWQTAAGLFLLAIVVAEQHALSPRGIAPDYGSDYPFAIPLLLGVFGIFTNWKGWPPLIEKAPAS